MHRAGQAPASAVVSRLAPSYSLAHDSRSSRLSDSAGACSPFSTTTTCHSAGPMQWQGKAANSRFSNHHNLPILLSSHY